MITLPSTNQWLIFTDLDGTLLDHHDYSHQAALLALDRLQQLNVPVIINSSKTLAEIKQIASDLALDTPQIAENGSLIYFPLTTQTITLGTDYRTICTTLDDLRQHYGYEFAGFHDLDAAQIASHTGLSLSAAKHSAQRNGTEPLLWHDTDKQLRQFQSQLESQDLLLKRGGRFWHVMGNTDKKQAMDALKLHYQQERGGIPFTIALGDSANDIDMLAHADVAVIVKNPHGSQITLPEAKSNTQQIVVHTDKPGPAGWNDAINRLLDQVDAG